MYQSLENLNEAYLQPNQQKNLLLKPSMPHFVTGVPLLLLGGLVTYMVMDDLSVMPMSMVSGVALQNKCNVKDFSVHEERRVDFSVNEGVQMLKASLRSKTALTDVFIVKRSSKRKRTGTFKYLIETS